MHDFFFIYFNEDERNERTRVRGCERERRGASQSVCKIGYFVYASDTQCWVQFFPLYSPSLFFVKFLFYLFALCVWWYGEHTKKGALNKRKSFILLYSHNGIKYCEKWGSISITTAICVWVCEQLLGAKKRRRRTFLLFFSCCRTLLLFGVLCVFPPWF